MQLNSRPASKIELYTKVCTCTNVADKECSPKAVFSNTYFSLVKMNDLMGISNLQFATLSIVNLLIASTKLHFTLLRLHHDRDPHLLESWIERKYTLKIRDSNKVKSLKKVIFLI